MNNEIDSEEENEVRPIRNFIKLCRYCDNQRKARTLTYYLHGLDQLKVCYYCKNEFSALRNNMVLSKISRIYKQKKIKQAKMDIVYALKPLRIGIQSGIHQHILEFVL